MTNLTLDDAREVLRQHWGYADFRKFQEEAIPHVLAGDNLLVVVQTGGGKSALFQIPAMLMEGTCIVFSPLIALMQDQVQECERRGIPASFINSRLEPEEVEERINDFVAGAYKLLYIAPERLSVRSFREALANATVSFIAIDEAHSVSRYGHAFRPDYMKLHVAGDIIEHATGKRPPLLMLTATCTAGIEEDIVRSLGVDREGCEIIVGDPIRPNLIYETIVPFGSPWTEIKSVARRRFGMEGRHLVYCATRGAADMLAEKILGQEWDRMGSYHAGKEKDRDKIQDAFKRGDLLRMSCTNAFGMGIDIPDIRTVIHFGIPGSVEDYVQEVGRGGRDGQESHGILIHDDRAIEMQMLFIDGSNPPPEFYPIVWAFICKATAPGTDLTMSAKKIGEAITAHGDYEVPTRAVATILNILDRHGLVERRYMKGAGSPVTVYRPTLKALLEDQPQNEALQKLGTRLLGGPVEVIMDAKKWQAELGLKAFGFNKAKKLIKDEGAADFGRAFTGKSTKVSPQLAGTDITDRLPLEGLQLKRQHDLGKLRSMIEYAGFRSLDERRSYIRAYFMDQPAEVVDISSGASKQLAETVDLLRELEHVGDIE